MDGERIAQVIEERLRERTIDALRELGLEMEDDLKGMLDTAYPPASTPGNPPHRRTGNLQNSIYSTVEEFVDAEPQCYVGFNQGQAPYGRYLEKGTSRMAARPFIARLKQQWDKSRIAARLAAAMKSYDRSQQPWK